MTAEYDVEVEDIEYANVEGVPLLARIYRPKGEGPFPAAVEVHGGAWTLNDRFTNVDIDRPLAASGAVVCAIDFRMPPQTMYPGTVADVNLAMRWFKANAVGFGTSADRVGLIGTSSGGHLALLNAMRPTDPRYAAHKLADAPDVDASAVFIALCWPVSDPYARYKMVQGNGNQRLVDAHDAFWPDLAAMDEGSPHRILGRGEAVALPPALLLQGTQDDNLGPDMSNLFAEAWRKAGGSLKLEVFDGAPHAFIARDPAAPRAKRAVQAIIDFVHANGG